MLDQIFGSLFPQFTQQTATTGPDATSLFVDDPNGAADWLSRANEVPEWVPWHPSSNDYSGATSSIEVTTLEEANPTPVELPPPPTLMRRTKAEIGKDIKTLKEPLSVTQYIRDSIAPRMEPVSNEVIEPPEPELVYESGIEAPEPELARQGYAVEQKQQAEIPPPPNKLGRPPEPISFKPDRVFVGRPGRSGGRYLPKRGVQYIVGHDTSGRVYGKTSKPEYTAAYHVTFDDKGFYHQRNLGRTAPHARHNNSRSIALAYHGFEGDKLSKKAIRNGARAALFIEKQIGKKLRILPHPKVQSGKNAKEASWAQAVEQELARLRGK